MQLFADDSYHEIYLHSYGVPRRINTICDLALLVGFSNNQNIISRKDIIDINDDMDLLKPDTEGLYQPTPQDSYGRYDRQKIRA